MSGFTLTWGIGGVFALPVAITVATFGDDARKCVCVHFGPLTVILARGAA